jgi:hypothetical protein
MAQHKDKPFTLIFKSMVLLFFEFFTKGHCSLTLSPIFWVLFPNIIVYSRIYAIDYN